MGNCFPIPPKALKIANVCYYGSLCLGTAIFILYTGFAIYLVLQKTEEALERLSTVIYSFSSDNTISIDYTRLHEDLALINHYNRLSKSSIRDVSSLLSLVALILATSKLIIIAGLRQNQQVNNVVISSQAVPAIMAVSETLSSIQIEVRPRSS